VTRSVLRIFLTICLIAATAFAGWSWFRPYAWSPDPAARCKIVETLVTRDQSFFWVNVHLKVIPGMTHDLQKPVVLETAAGKRLEPADTIFATDEDRRSNEIWFKFWLESPDLTGDLVLHLNDGKLQVKSGNGVPPLESSASRNYTSNRW
jgi:hypothetical protein